MNNILILGANGKTGKRVLNKLTKLGLPAKGVSRSSQPSFDWTDRSTWAPVLQHVDAVYITYQPDIAAPGAENAIREFSALAKKQGVRKLVLLSGRGEKEAQLCESIVIHAGMEWTIVRASWFCQNFDEGTFVEQVQAGYVSLPVGKVGEPFVDADDIADVVVAALTEEGHNSKVYEVTGPRLLTFQEAVEEISRAAGKPVQYEQIPMEAYAAVLTEYEVPDEVISLITYLFTEVLDGRNESITDGVQQALGRKPTDFSEYARKAAATGVWG